MTLTTPNGGDQLFGTYSLPVAWDSSGLIDHFVVQLSTDSGQTYPDVLAAHAAGSPLAWAVDNITTTTARLRVQALDAQDNVLVQDESDADFSITATGILMGTPNGGETDTIGVLLKRS